MQLEITSTLVAVVISGLSTLVAVVSGWVTIRTQLTSINDHLATSNGRLDDHDDDLKDQGQRLSHLEGAMPHVGPD